jgi:alpha-L-fucosidase
MPISNSPEHAWFNEARYGLFIHWGVYSVAARGEWVRNRERIPQEEYVRLYAENFRAENYDPKAWAALAKEAGMGYLVLTARHHDGFALWPTKTSEFHAGRIGPKRDLIGPYVEAVRAAGLKVGLYYSPADWHHPDYPGPFFRDWPKETDWAGPAARERFIAYYRAQLVELMSNYGKIDYLWFDGCVPDDLQRREVNEELLRLQPHLLINERNGQPSHVKISEQAIHAPKPGGPLRYWEACMTLNENWGWHAGDQRWKSASEVVKMLGETARDGGNLLLNVGPKPDGTIPAASVRILREAGEWLRRNREAISNSERGPFSTNNWGSVSMRGSRVYLQIRNGTGPELCWAECNNKVLSARWLVGGEPVAFEQTPGRLYLRGLPVPLPDPIASTIVLEIEGLPKAVTEQVSFWMPG